MLFRSERIPDLVLRARPDSTLLAIGSELDPASRQPVLDVNAVAERLWADGWYVDRQGPPPSLHCTVNAVHESMIDEFVADLRSAVDDVRRSGLTGERGAYGTVD